MEVVEEKIEFFSFFYISPNHWLIDSWVHEGRTH